MRSRLGGLVASAAGSSEVLARTLWRAHGPLFITTATQAKWQGTVVRRASAPRRVDTRWRSSAAASLPPMKAAAMVVGDEILNGKVTDTNTPWLAKLLFQ